jgi:hypothetical protein
VGATLWAWLSARRIAASRFRDLQRCAPPWANDAMGL